MNAHTQNAQTQAEQVVAHMMAHDAFSQWLGIAVEKVSPGRVVLTMTVRADMLNGFGIGHGGVTFALADSALAFASNTYGRVAVALENNILFPNPVAEGDVLRAEATELHATTRTAAYDVVVTRADGVKVGLFRGTVYRTKKPHFEGDSGEDHDPR